MKNIFIIITVFLIILGSCRKYKSSTKCTVEFVANQPIDKVSYGFNGIKYQGFNAFGEVISSGKLYKIDPFHFKLDTVINRNELSSLTLKSLLETDTINEADYQVIMTLGADGIVYEKRFKGAYSTGSFIEF